MIKGRYVWTSIPDMLLVVSIFFLIYYLNSQYQKAKERYGFPINFADIGVVERYPELYGYTSAAGRIYENILVTKDESENKARIDIAQTKIREILFQRDTLHGIHFIFSKDAKYKTLIRLLDILKIEKAEFFVTDNIFSFFYYQKPLRDTTPQIEVIYL